MNLHQSSLLAQRYQWTSITLMCQAPEAQYNKLRVLIRQVGTLHRHLRKQLTTTHLLNACNDASAQNGFAMTFECSCTLQLLSLKSCRPHAPKLPYFYLLAVSQQWAFSWQWSGSALVCNNLILSSSFFFFFSPDEQMWWCLRDDRAGSWQRTHVLTPKSHCEK